MKVLYIFADQPYEENCSLHNCKFPADAINRSGTHTANYIHMSQFVTNTEEVQKLCMEADIIILERNLFQDALTLLTFWKVRGKMIMIIFDDGYHTMHPKNVSYPFWTYGDIEFVDQNGVKQTGKMVPPPIEQLKWGIQMSAGLQTVSQALADYWRFANDTYVINNHLVIDRYIGVEPLHKHDGEIYIGWTGSLSHVDSFEGSGLLRAFRKICKNHRNVRILISGDKRIFDLVDVPQNQKIFQPFVSNEQYPSLIKTLDICTVPLYGPYDECRSWIKPLECCALKVPAIATNFPNYAQLKDYITVTENGWQNWENAINDAIEKLPDYKARAEEVAYPFALTQSLDLHVQERIDLYQHVIDKGYNREQSVN
jgi:glycosyltransferase involved in cell wall biosynthesis